MKQPVKVNKDGGGSAQVSNSFLNPIHRVWNPIFETCRDLDYGVENTPYIETYVGLGEEGSVVRAFMRGLDETDVCSPQADKVERFCNGANLEFLRAEKGKVSESLPLVALLDERSFEGGIGRSRTYRGPLTARDLYRELRKPRFRCDGSGHSIGSTISARSGATATAESEATSYPGSLDTVQQDESDAERRLIFVTDLDRWSVLALIGTASYYQALNLRESLYRHLAFETFIGVILSSDGLPMFQLTFHLPYYLCRVSQMPREDHRRYENGEPLRQFQDVSFLNWKSRRSPIFLYEAQISCMLAGTDEGKWVAYCFVDSYFDAEEDKKDSVQSYHDDSLGEQVLRVDPFTYGDKDADIPVQKPREYFLMVFRIRTNQIKREWQQVVTKLQQSIREYEQTHHYPLSRSRERFSSKEGDECDEKIRKSFDWIVRFMNLSTKLSEGLSKTVDAWEWFCFKHAMYFQNISESAYGHQSLPAIQTTFEELESLKKTLEYMGKRCGRLARELELHLILESKEAGNHQRELAKDSKRLTVIMVKFVSPISLTAAIFSMNKDVIPFIPASPGSFVCLILIFAILGIVIQQSHAAVVSIERLALVFRDSTNPLRKLGELTAQKICQSSFLLEPTKRYQQGLAYSLESTTRYQQGSAYSKPAEEVPFSPNPSAAAQPTHIVSKANQEEKRSFDQLAIRDSPTTVEAAANMTYEEEVSNMLAQWDCQLCGVDRIAPLSISDMIKHKVQRVIRARMVWWPLCPPRERLAYGYTRILWKDDIEFDVEDERLAEILEEYRITASAPSASLLPTHSAVTNTPSGQAQINSKDTSSTGVLRSTLSTPTHCQAGKSTAQTVVNALSITTLDDNRYLCWCVEDFRRNVMLVTIPVTQLSNMDLKTKLMQKFQEVRGRWSWLSLTVCDGVKFTKFARIELSRPVIAASKRTIPTDPAKCDYEFDYHPPDDIFMERIEKLVGHRLREKHWCRCHPSQHRCVCKDVLRYLPKKKGKVENEMWAEGYGIRATTGLSLLRTVIAVLTLQIPPLIFAIRWLVGHPGDLQNAFFLDVLLMSMLNVFVMIPDLKIVDKLD